MIFNNLQNMKFFFNSEVLTLLFPLIQIICNLLTFSKIVYGIFKKDFPYNEVFFFISFIKRSNAFIERLIFVNTLEIIDVEKLSRIITLSNWHASRVPLKFMCIEDKSLTKCPTIT